MKNETRVALKYHFILNVMLPPLWCEYIIEHKSLIHEAFLTFKDGLMADDSIWDYGQWMSLSGIKFHNMPHLFTIRTEDCRFFHSVAESLQDCCLACVSPPNHKDTELSKLCSDFSNLLYSELRLWWGRHCERCSQWCGMIKTIQVVTVTRTSHTSYSQLSFFSLHSYHYVWGRWKSVQQCPSCSW